MIRIKNKRSTERFFILLNIVICGLLFIQLYRLHQQKFKDVPKRLKEGTMVNLNDPKIEEKTRLLLEKGYYFQDGRDVALISSVVGKVQARQQGKQIDNVGELNKEAFFLSADEAFSAGGVDTKNRVLASRRLLGFAGADSSRFVQESRNPPVYPSNVRVAMGEHSISGRIINKEDKNPVEGVLVRLEMLLPQDSLSADGSEGPPAARKVKGPGFISTFERSFSGKYKLRSLLAYARTGKDGAFSFQHLPDNKAFKILPLQPGFQFGRSQGISRLEHNIDFNFSRSPHSIKLLSTRDFNILKKEQSLIVRSIEEFNVWYFCIAAGFFVGFIAVHLLLCRRFPEADPLILPVVMLLTGLSFLIMLSLQDPLRDRFLARDTLTYFGFGLAVVILALFLNLRKFNPDSVWYRLFLFKGNKDAASGWPWAILATSLLILTIVFGAGPEGSGVKVNLFGFQPSEVAKYLIVIFLAGFFTLNERFIREYSTYRKRWAFFSTALVAVFSIILFFLVLGDLGPAMVICFTFIILFSFCRGDFLFMAATILLYVLAGWVFSNMVLASGLVFILAALGMLFIRKQLSESSIMAMVVIAGFLLLDKVPYLDNLFPGPIERLVERKAIWQNAWDNEVFGGDHVANAIWAIAGGGFTGQGIGEGYAKTIPEAHTDMILPAIGEEFGWTGISAVFILFLILLHRAIIIGRQTGRPFLFYLCAGIGISTFIQFLLIAGGSTGALPLSGVSLPFLSYGGSSLVVNMLAVGFLLSASLVRGTEIQMSYLSQQQDRNLVPALIAACFAILLLNVNVFSYLLNNKDWVVRPALVVDRSGNRMFSYNPRISILMRKLAAGSLLDRYGRILATSEPARIRSQFEVLKAAGVGNYNLDSAVHKRLDRYYPFSEQTFFWTGDANTGIFRGSVNGYFADYEHEAELRGFRVPAKAIHTMAAKYREERFLPETSREMTIRKRDYKALAPMILAGANSRLVEDFKRKNRDVQLTLDAAMQTAIQKSISNDTSLLDNRVSVVIMESNLGDVLTSAVYPLAPVNNQDLLSMGNTEQQSFTRWVTASDLGFTYASQPGSTAKIITSLAAFNKIGLAAASKTYQVLPKERIRTTGPEPDETGMITMEQALVKSNNVYFIKLANEEALAPQMTDLYVKTGMFLHGVGGYFYQRPEETTATIEEWKKLWQKTEFSGTDYNPANIRKNRAKGISGMAWGQGNLVAAPASVARLTCAIVNGGSFVENRFVLRLGQSKTPVQGVVKLAHDQRYAELIKYYMVRQSEKKRYQLNLKVGGKTGTPERVWKNERINDGWYTFFAPKVTGTGYIVVCVRIERTKGSSDAVTLAGKHVIPYLLKHNYIKSLPEENSQVQKSEEQVVSRAKQTDFTDVNR